MQLLKTIASLAAAGALAIPVHGTPLATRQATTDPCAGLGSNAASTLSGSFTLAALNTTLPNANATGAPLVLFSGNSGHGYTEWWPVPWASDVYPAQPAGFTLSGGALTSGSAVSNFVSSGGRVTLISTSPTAATPQLNYCAAAPSTTGGYRQLAVNGHTDLFTLCPSNPGLVTLLMYDFAGPSYDGHDCYPVKLQIVPQ